jgi:hypothetical protein
MIMRSVVHQTHEIMAREMQEGRDFFGLSRFQAAVAGRGQSAISFAPAKHEIAASAAAHSI